MLEHHVDVHALAGDVPDRLAEACGPLSNQSLYSGVFTLGIWPQQLKSLRLITPLAPRPMTNSRLSSSRDDADGVGAGGVDQLDRVGAEAARRAPDQHVLPGLQVMRLVAEQHPVGGGERQRVAGRFLPRQVPGARHELLRLHAGELGKAAVGRLVAPDALGRARTSGRRRCIPRRRRRPGCSG